MKRFIIPDDWTEEDGYISVLFCIPNSQRWRGLVVGLINSLSFGWSWDEKTGSIKGVQAIGRDIFESMTMGCIEEFTSELRRTNAILAGETITIDVNGVPTEFDYSGAPIPRMADALEGLDEKTAQLVTWDDFIQDLQDTLGIGNALVSAISFVGSLFPRISAKMDFTPLALGMWEYMRWKAPILALLTQISASLAAIAAATLAEKPLKLLDTIFTGFNSLLNLNNRIYDFILGEWSWYDNVIKPIWDSFISDEEGGTGGTDPDADPTIRIETRLVVDNDFTEAIADKLEEIKVMLETRMVAETTAGNTRANQLNSVIDAIENVLGGDYVPPE